MAKDILGNELAQGRLVQVTLDSNRVYGKISNIQNGGLAIAGQQGVTPGMVIVSVEIPLLLDPQNPQLRNVVLVVDPDQKKTLIAGQA